MTIAEKIQELKDWLDENPLNLPNSDIINITKHYTEMKEYYNL